MALPTVDASPSDGLRFTGRVHGMQEVTGSQVALAWCMAKDTVPIPGAKSLEQCQSNLAAMRLRLSPGEVAALDEAATRITTPMVQNSMASN